MNDEQLRRKALQVYQDISAICFVSATKLTGGKSGLIEENDKRQRAVDAEKEDSCGKIIVPRIKK